MSKQSYLLIFFVLLTAILLSACGTEAVPEPVEQPSEPQPTTAAEEPYPEPEEEQPVQEAPTEPVEEPYPQPEAPSLPEVVPPNNDHEFAPKPEDATLARGEVFLDSAEIQLLESYPVQVELALVGSLPTPCYELRAVVSPADDQNRIEVEVYSVVDPEMTCTQVLEPFDASLPLGAYTEGSYSVSVNGEEVGTFDLP